MKNENAIVNPQSFATLSKRDQRREIKIEESLEQLSYWMDDAIRIPGLGWRFGLDARSIHTIISWKVPGY